MKISKIFHFLYFSVLSIPLVTIPIFAIYSQNHEINDNTLTINESYWEVQNKYQTNEVNDDYTNLVNGNIYKITNNQDLYDFINNIGSIYLQYFYYQDLNYLDYFISYVNPGDLNLVLNINSDYNYLQFSNDDDVPFIQITADYIYLVSNEWETYKTQLNYYGVTMNESDYIPLEYVYHENTPVVYDDTDIMSQFMYQEYNFMDKYLGMYKYQPFSGIYSWLSNTFFGGSAPLVFTIFYQWFAYWLLISFCWLIFDVLMYVPLLVHKWLDKAAIE